MLVSEGSPRTSTLTGVGVWVETGEVTAGLPRRNAPGELACTSEPDPAGPPPLLLMVHRHGYGLQKHRERENGDNTPRQDCSLRETGVRNRVSNHDFISSSDTHWSHFCREAARCSRISIN